jgi:type IV pilus assembly protein PilY1
MVYTAANDGMLHAFRIGTVNRVQYNASTPNRIAELSNSPIDNNDPLLPGDEEWAYIPRNVLPYLKYYGDPAYNHLYYVNNTVLLADVSIGKTDSDSTCTASEYWKCSKKTTYASTVSKDLLLNETSWKTVLLGGMGLGGASRDYNEFCNAVDSATVSDLAHETRKDCVKSPIPNIGLSSFYALDVSEPRNPKFMWEFSDAVLPASDKGLGYTISGPAIVRINTKNPVTNTYGNSDTTKNGRWFAVFATGPTGPIDTINHQFLGRSDQKLKIYVVDINPDLSNGWIKNTNYWVFDSGYTDAFASDLTDVVVDVDRWNPSSPSYYSDDVVYIGYTKRKSADNTWTDGGILRLITNDSINPAEWKLSTLASGLGPVVSSPTKLQDRKKGKLWVYFGTGRYFFKDQNGTDDEDSQRHLFGIEDTCYDGVKNTMNGGWNASNIPLGCNASSPAELTFSNLQDQSTTIVNTLPTDKKGWYIALDPSGNYKMGSQMIESAYGAERVVTNTTANFNGTIFYTTFKPSEDVCSYGGSTSEWIVDYATGGVPPASTMKGKLLVQLSGGEFITIDLATATKGITADDATRGDRRIKANLAGHGIAGSKGGSLQSASQPIRKILHIIEK